MAVACMRGFMKIRCCCMLMLRVVWGNGLGGEKGRRVAVHRHTGPNSGGGADDTAATAWAVGDADREAVREER